MPILITLHTLLIFSKKIPRNGLILVIALLFGLLILVSRGWIVVIIAISSLFKLGKPSRFTLFLLGLLFMIALIDSYLYQSAPVMPALGTFQNFLAEQLHSWWQNLVLLFPIHILYWISAFAVAIPLVFIKPSRSTAFLASLDNRFFEPVLYILHRWANRWFKQIHIFGLQFLLSFLFWFLAFQLLAIPAAFILSVFAACAMLSPFFGFWIALLPPFLIVLPGNSSWQLIGLVIAAAVMWLIQYLVVDDLDPQFVEWHPVWEALAILCGFFGAGLWGVVFTVPLITLTRILVDPLISAYHYYCSDLF